MLASLLMSALAPLVGYHPPPSPSSAPRVRVAPTSLLASVLWSNLETELVPALASMVRAVLAQLKASMLASAMGVALALGLTSPQV